MSIRFSNMYRPIPFFVCCPIMHILCFSPLHYPTPSCCHLPPVFCHISLQLFLLNRCRRHQSEKREKEKREHCPIKGCSAKKESKHGRMGGCIPPNVAGCRRKRKLNKRKGKATTVRFGMAAVGWKECGGEKREGFGRPL